MLTTYNPNIDYTLQIDNGGSNGEFARVSSAKVFLNGVQVLGTSDFNQSVAVLEKSTNLVTTNELVVELASKAGSGITLRIIGVDNDPPTIAAEDFNGDATLDLAVLNVIGNVFILLGDEAGGFSTPTSFLTGSGGFSVAVGDFNRDTILDLATTNIGNFGESNVAILLGKQQ